jgi:hypothetical protein
MCLVLLPAAAACGDDDDDQVAKGCPDDSPLCGSPCKKTAECGLGLRCADGTCAPECDEPGSAKGCDDGEVCSKDRICMRATASSGSGGHGGFGNGGTSGGRPDTGTGTSDGSVPTCASTVVRASKIIPTVILIVDQSGSMTEKFADGTRWDVLRGFLLMQPGGLIDDLQTQVRFGLAMYSARSGENDPAPVGECPLVTSVAPALNNFPAISAVYSPAEPIDDTPTGDSINKIIDDLDLANDPDAQPSATIFVLATDGEPDRCEELDPQTDEGKREAIESVQRAFSLGIRTFIISVGEGTVSAEHQQAMANAGLGLDGTASNAEYWVAGDDRSLRDALVSIVGGQVGCDVALNGRVDSGDPCLGKVTLNGEELGCGDPNGWELVDDMHIRLSGQACDDLKSRDDALLDVTFPCGVDVVF